MKKKSVFSLIELLVVISIIAVLAALSLTGFNLVRERGKMSSCMNNLKQIGFCLHQYAADNQDALPVCERFTSTYGLPTIKSVLISYAANNDRVFCCPSDRSNYLTHGTSYEWNSFVSGCKIDKNTFVVGAVAIIAPLCGDADNYHKSGKNFLYSDSHVSNSYDLLLKEKP